MYLFQLVHVQCVQHSKHQTIAPKTFFLFGTVRVNSDVQRMRTYKHAFYWNVGRFSSYWNVGRFTVLLYGHGYKSARKQMKLNFAECDAECVLGWWVTIWGPSWIWAIANRKRANEVDTLRAFILKWTANSEAITSTYHIIIMQAYTNIAFNRFSASLAYCTKLLAANEQKSTTNTKFIYIYIIWLNV